jgi:hypothetical protein
MSIADINRALSARRKKRVARERAELRQRRGEPGPRCELRQRRGKPRPRCESDDLRWIAAELQRVFPLAAAVRADVNGGARGRLLKGQAFDFMLGVVGICGAPLWDSGDKRGDPALYVAEVRRWAEGEALRVGAEGVAALPLPLSRDVHLALYRSALALQQGV